jgi:hypothetical protein
LLAPSTEFAANNGGVARLWPEFLLLVAFDVYAVLYGPDLREF